MIIITITIAIAIRNNNKYFVVLYCTTVLGVKFDAVQTTKDKLANEQSLFAMKNPPSIPRMPQNNAASSRIQIIHHGVYHSDDVNVKKN